MLGPTEDEVDRKLLAVPLGRANRPIKTCLLSISGANTASPGSEAFTSRSDSCTLGGRKRALLL